MLKSHRILLPSDLSLKFDCEETGTTFIENARQKALALRQVAGPDYPILADDSGLSVEALNWQPNIRTARYGMKEDGIELSSEERNALMLKNMTGVTNRTAYFTCALCLYISPFREFIIQESCKGEIALAPFGDGGFGYDPIFLVKDADNRNMASLTPDEKDRYSHRGLAMARLKQIMETL